MMKVMKFGGTSMGSVDSLERVMSIVSKGSGKRTLVVSAMSGVTNTLIEWIKERNSSVEEVIELLRKRHLETVRALIDEGPIFDSYIRRLDSELSRLKEIMDHMRDQETEPLIRDAISSWGERLSSLNTACLLRSRGFDAVPLSAEETGIVATGSPGFATADLEQTSANLKENIVPLLDENKIPVITGYYGCDEQGRPHTFGRGGSDYSASVVAYGLDADLLEIWTDVDGFMTSDPTVVSGARTISEMDYGEAAELAYFGARVLHARTIDPVRRKRITVAIKNTFNPEGEGTLIRELRSPGHSLLRSVAMRRDLSIVKVYSSEIVYDPGLVCKIITSISGNGITTYAISTSLSTLAVVIPSRAVNDAVASLKALKDTKIEDIKVKSGMSLICAVGDEMLETSGVAASVFNVVEMAGANLELISEGASDVALNFVVPNYTADGVVKRLHEMFIGD